MNPQQLDPTNPEDAVKILYRITRLVALSADDHDALATANQTLSQAVKSKAVTTTETPERITSLAQDVLERMSEPNCNLHKVWHEVKEVLEYVAPKDQHAQPTESKFVPN